MTIGYVVVALYHINVYIYHLSMRAWLHTHYVVDIFLLNLYLARQVR